MDQNLLLTVYAPSGSDGQYDFPILVAGSSFGVAIKDSGELEFDKHATGIQGLVNAFRVALVSWFMKQPYDGMIMRTSPLEILLSQTILFGSF
jgi:hypothetical protein